MCIADIQSVDGEEGWPCCAGVSIRTGPRQLHLTPVLLLLLLGWAPAAPAPLCREGGERVSASACAEQRAARSSDAIGSEEGRRDAETAETISSPQINTPSQQQLQRSVGGIYPIATFPLSFPSSRTEYRKFQRKFRLWNSVDIKNPSIEDIVGAQVVVFWVEGRIGREHVELALHYEDGSGAVRTRVP